ncbi:MAG: adenylate kinase [Eubacteriales bacterium]|jgi:adenylate kinase|nr:adenylate kinase [Eubacteriales bacterium]MDD4326669.1 adenylate kinase [Eubacteriales bacterium]MDD4716989.1 adenylate kinase [Eubacteriales bacterium]
MRIILLGAPGAGKGSVGRPLSSQLEIPVISTGDIFRSNISGRTKLGLTAKGYMDRGELVPDGLTVSIVEDRIAQSDCAKGFILDGFPRNTFQASELDRILEKANLKIDLVLNVHLSDERIIQRLSSRMVCSSCGESYNRMSKDTSMPGICDLCGGRVSVREDDAPETVRKRLETYYLQTMPLIDFYRERGILSTIDNDCTIEEGSKRALEAVRNALPDHMSGHGRL